LMPRRLIRLVAQLDDECVPRCGGFVHRASHAELYTVRGNIFQFVRRLLFGGARAGVVIAGARRTCKDNAIHAIGTIAMTTIVERGGSRGAVSMAGCGCCRGLGFLRLAVGLVVLIGVLSAGERGVCEEWRAGTGRAKITPAEMGWLGG